MKRTRNESRTGFTLLEMAVSVAMLATLATSSVVLVRTSYTAWNRHEDDHQQRRAALAVVRHLMRNARQAIAVTAISAASDASGTISLSMSNGNLLVWDHDATSKEVRFGTNAATDLLAKNIEEFTLVGFKVDGTTATNETDLIHSVRCTVKFNLTRPNGTQLKTVSCQAWLRSW